MSAHRCLHHLPLPPSPPGSAEWVDSSLVSGLRQPVPWERFASAPQTVTGVAFPESCGLSSGCFLMGTGWTLSPTHPVGLEAPCICVWRSGLA